MGAAGGVAHMQHLVSMLPALQSPNSLSDSFDLPCALGTQPPGVWTGLPSSCRHWDCASTTLVISSARGNGTPK